LQQYYSAFYTAGYSNVSSLVGLTDNHLNVIQRSAPGGIPEEHRGIILAAAKQLSTQQPLAFLDTANLAESASLKPNASAAATAQPNHSAATVAQDSAQQERAEAGLHTQAGRLAESNGLGSTMSSYTSFGSSGSDLDTTQADSRASTLQSSLASAAVQGLQHGHNGVVDNVDRPAPSQHQLQELYSQMEADYKRLQDRPARGSVKPPHAAEQPGVSVKNSHSSAPAEGRIGIAGKALVTASAAGGKAVAPLPHAQRPAKRVTSSGYGQAGHQPSLNNVISHQDHRDVSVLNSASDAETKAKAGVSGRVGPAAALKQMKKGKKTWPDEPFVQVFTNFHKL